MAILLPLGLIAAIYGMHGIDLKNIREMPAGFLIVLITMAFIVIGLVLFFVKKRWVLFGKTNNESSYETSGDEHSKTSSGAS